MNILSLIVASAVINATPSVSPQSDQDRLDTRYDRALAAGYKALFLCSAIANAERNGTTRTPESVHEWELTGIYPRLDPVIRDLKYEIVRGPDNRISHVKVEWSDEMPARLAVHKWSQGCVVQPIGSTISSAPSEPYSGQSAEAPRQRPAIDPMAANLGDKRVDVGGAFSGKYGEGRTTVVTVLYEGKLVGEQYADGFFATTPQRTWSVAKSIAATLVGAAVHRGEANVSDSAGLGEGSEDPRHAITIDHALRMASGRYSDTPGNRTDPLYWGGTTVDERAQNWPLIHSPGTVYRYANNDTLAAVKAIEDTFDGHSPADVLRAIGMKNTVAETDWQGNYVLSSQVWSTARDLARLGQLMLNDGVTQSGERILPKGWREYVSSPSGPQPEGRPFGYGAGWWLMNNSEGVPPDTFAAFGNRGQYVVVVPSRKVVIVRRGENMVGTRFDIAAFTRDVLASLDE